MFENADSDPTDGGQMYELSSWPARYKKTVSSLIFFLILVLVWFSVGFNFLAFSGSFSEYFSVIFCFSMTIHIRIHYHFSIFCKCMAVGPLECPLNPAVMFPFAKGSSHATRGRLKVLLVLVIWENALKRVCLYKINVQCAFMTLLKKTPFSHLHIHIHLVNKQTRTRGSDSFFRTKLGQSCSV